MTAILYNSYKASFISSFSQPTFASYTANTDFTVTSNPGSALEGVTGLNNHLNFPLTYEFSWDLLSSTYTNRGISYIIMYFTNGVRLIEDAWFRYSISPFYINKAGSIKSGYDTSVNRWHINITGIMDSIQQESQHWFVRVRLYANDNSISYTSSIYNFNGNLEFNPTSGSRNTNSDSWSSSYNFGFPNKFVPY